MKELGLVVVVVIVADDDCLFYNLDHLVDSSRSCERMSAPKAFAAGIHAVASSLGWTKSSLVTLVKLAPAWVPIFLAWTSLAKIN